MKGTGNFSGAGARTSRWKTKEGSSKLLCKIEVETLPSAETIFCATLLFSYKSDHRSANWNTLFVINNDIIHIFVDMHTCISINMCIISINDISDSIYVSHK